jgi:hypothetical protein
MLGKFFPLPVRPIVFQSRKEMLDRKKFLIVVFNLIVVKRIGALCLIGRPGNDVIILVSFLFQYAQDLEGRRQRITQDDT